MDFSRFTRKLGPLPIWAWGLIIVGGAAALLFVGRGSSSAATDSGDGSTDTTSDVEYDASGDQTQDSSGSIGLASNGSTSPIHVVVDSLPAGSGGVAKPVGPGNVPMPTASPKKGYRWVWSYTAKKWYQAKIATAASTSKPKPKTGSTLTKSSTADIKKGQRS